MCFRLNSARVAVTIKNSNKQSFSDLEKKKEKEISRIIRTVILQCIDSEVEKKKNLMLHNFGSPLDVNFQILDHLLLIKCS